jgi:hypothetical protein
MKRKYRQIYKITKPFGCGRPRCQAGRHRRTLLEPWSLKQTEQHAIPISKPKQKFGSEFTSRKYVDLEVKNKALLFQMGKYNVIAKNRRFLTLHKVFEKGQ